MSNTLKGALLFSSFFAQSLVCVAGTYWHYHFFTQTYLRGDTQVSLYFVAIIVISIWSLLLVAESRLITASSKHQRHKILLSFVYTIVCACVTIIFFNNLFTLYPVTFIGSWIIPLTTLTGGTISRPKPEASLR